MPYLLLALGVIIGGVLILRGLRRADPVNAARTIRYIFVAILLLAAGFLTLTGKWFLGAPLALFALPFLLGDMSLKGIDPKQFRPRARTSQGGPMTEEEALNILGLQSGATSEEIKAAHKRLITRMHPDQGGSTYLAAKLNYARDLLLGLTDTAAAAHHTTTDFDDDAGGAAS